MFFLLVGSLLEQFRDLLVAFFLGFRGVVGVLVARLRFAGECCPQVGFRFRSFQIFHVHGLVELECGISNGSVAKVKVICKYPQRMRSISFCRAENIFVGRRKWWDLPFPLSFAGVWQLFHGYVGKEGLTGAVEALGERWARFACVCFTSNDLCEWGERIIFAV